MKLRLRILTEDERCRRYHPGEYVIGLHVGGTGQVPAVLEFYGDVPHPRVGTDEDGNAILADGPTVYAWQPVEVV